MRTRPPSARRSDEPHSYWIELRHLRSSLLFESEPRASYQRRRCSRFRSCSHCIVGHAVVPKNFALVFITEWQPKKRIDGFRIARINVRIVRGKNQIIAADLLDDIAGDHFVGFYGHSALPL